MAEQWRGLTVTLIITITIHKGDTHARVEDGLECLVRRDHRVARRGKEILHYCVGAQREVDGNAERLLHPALVVECRGRAKRRPHAWQGQGEVKLRSLVRYFSVSSCAIHSCVLCPYLGVGEIGRAKLMSKEKGKREREREEKKGGRRGGAHIRFQIQPQQPFKTRRRGIHTHRIHLVHIARPLRVELSSARPTIRHQSVARIHQVTRLLVHLVRHCLDPIRIVHHHLRETRELALNVHTAIVDPERAQFDLHGALDALDRLVLPAGNARVLRRNVHRARGAEKPRVRVRPQAERRRRRRAVRELLQPHLRKRPHLRGDLGRGVGRVRAVLGAHAGDRRARVDDDRVCCPGRGGREDVARDVKGPVGSAAGVAVSGLHGHVDVEHVAVRVEGVCIGRRGVAVGADGAGEAAAAVEEARRGPAGQPQGSGRGVRGVAGGEVPVEEGGVVGLASGVDGEGEVARIGGGPADGVVLVGEGSTGKGGRGKSGGVLGLGDKGLGERHWQEAHGGEKGAVERHHLEGRVERDTGGIGC